MKQSDTELIGKLRAVYLKENLSKDNPLTQIVMSMQIGLNQSRLNQLMKKFERGEKIKIHGPTRKAVIIWLDEQNTTKIEKRSET